MNLILDDIPALARLSPRSRLDRLMGEQERNYARLLCLLPLLRRLEGRRTSSAAGMPDLHLEVLEQSAYTTTLVLTYTLRIDGGALREPELQLRCYHDARMVEVFAVREPGADGRVGWSPLRHSSLGRKWRLNRFLGKWLAYCLLQGHGAFVPEDEAHVASCEGD